MTYSQKEGLGSKEETWHYLVDIKKQEIYLIPTWHVCYNINKYYILWKSSLFLE